MTNSTSESSTPGRLNTPLPGVFFWLTMLFAVTAGQTVCDAVNGKLDLDAAGALPVSGILAVIALAAVLSRKKYVPWTYWIAISACSMFTNALADYMAGPLKLGTLWPSLIFAVVLCAALGVRFARKRDRAVETAVSFRDQALYWLAILAMLAFGTSFGDLVADRLGIGDRATVLVFAALICVVVFAYFRRSLMAVTTFWLCLGLMQPMSNSLGDLISLPAKNGSFGAGPVATSVLLVVLAAGLIFYESRYRHGSRFD